MLSNKGRRDTTKLGSNVVQELKINQRRILIDSLEIGIPAPEQMIALGERQLPNGVKVGQILNSKTLNYKKLTPHRDGLFCERIFGPVQSFVCACGKKKESGQGKSKHKDVVKANLLPPLPSLKGMGGIAEIRQKKSSFFKRNKGYITAQTEVAFCPKCQVEYISKNVRRHRLGYIKLFAPVTHIWYLKGRPSYLSLFLGKRKKAITALAYCNAYLVEQVFSDLKTQNLLKDATKSVSGLVQKVNLQIWQNSDSNDFDLQKNTVSLSTNKIKDSDFDLKEIETLRKESASSSDSKVFFILLIQLFPEILTQNLQTKSQDIPESLPKLDSSERQTVLKQGFNKSSTYKTTAQRSINFNTNFTKLNIQSSDLPSKRLKYKVSTKLEAVKYFVETTLATTSRTFYKSEGNAKMEVLHASTHAPVRNGFVFNNSTPVSVQRDTLKVSRIPYVRAQALPFLPSLICSFHLRDSLISFLQSLPCKEDIPIPMYCQTPRRYPLRDVHKFLAELRSTNTQNQAERLTNESVIKFTKGTNHKWSQRDKIIDTKKQLSVTQNRKDSKKKAFIGTRTRIKERIFTINGLGIKHLIKTSGDNKTVTHFRSSYMDQVAEKAKRSDLGKTELCSQNKTELGRNTKLSEREIGCFTECKKFVFTTVSNLAFLPLDFSFVANSSIIHKSFDTFLHSDTKSVSDEIVVNANHSTNQLVSPEGSLAGISTPAQLLAKETKMCLRKVLLNTFLNRINFKLVDSSLSVDQSQITDRKQATVGESIMHNQHKYIKNSPNSEDIRVGNQANIKTLSCTSFFTVGQVVLRDPNSGLLSKKNTTRKLDLQNKTKLTCEQNQVSLDCISNNSNNRLDELKRENSANLQLDFNQIFPQYHTQLFPKLSDKPGFFKRKEPSNWLFAKNRKKIKYKPKLTYRYVPILLYARKFNFEEHKINSTGISSRFSLLQYKYCQGLTLPISNKPKVELCDRHVDEIVVHNASAFHNQYVDELNSDLQTFFFRKRLNTYQARLLHIVFGTLPQNTPLNQLTRIKSSFLHQNKVLVHNQKKAFFGTGELGYTYLLTKHQQEQKQDQLDKSEMDAKSLFWYACLQKQTQLLKKEKLELKSSFQSKKFSKLKEEESTKFHSNKIKAFTEFNLSKFGKVQRSLYLKKYHLHSCVRTKSSILYNPLVLHIKDFASTPNQVIPNAKIRSLQQPGSAFIKDPLYKIDLNPVQVSRTKSILATQTVTTQKDTKQNTVRSTSFGTETISKWHINGAKEILLYTGGGALESLLKRFDTSMFCQFLLGELEMLRSHYKDQILVEYNKKKVVAEHGFDSSSRNYLNSKGEFKPTFDMNLAVSSSKIATEHILDHKERDLRLKNVVTDKSVNIFCRRIYKTTRRLKIVQLLMRNKRRPEWMMISVLPVLPPDLRPVLQMGDNLIVASDLNTLYQRVIYRNNRHYKGRFLDFHFVSSIHRLVQDAVDRLIENGKGGSPPFLTPGGRPLKSLSDILKGKRGRFRFNLLGKRVDFSGRSVIVVDPNLKIHECGLPKEMALELYKYLLIRQLLLQKYVSNIVNAKKIIKERKPFIWDILRQMIYYHPVLLNRAPTLHRLGIQAFQPKVILGNAILLHPLVCTGFNADFDGDQMGVPLPLSPQARAEAWDLLWSRNNLLSPATGQPILLPSQDMVLGFYYMSSLLPYGTRNKAVSQTSFLKEKDKNKINQIIQKSSGYTKPKVIRTKSKIWKTKRFYKQVRTHVFSNSSQIVHAYQKKQIDIHTPIWYQLAGKSENGEKSQIPLELRIDAFGDRTQIYSTYHCQNKIAQGVNTSFFSIQIRTTVGRVLINNLIRQNH